MGSLLVDNRLIDEAAAELQPEHFAEPLHSRIFEVIVVLALDGAVSPLLLFSVMKGDEGLKELGDMAYLAALAGSAPAMPPIREFCRALKDLALRRELIGIGTAMADGAHARPGQETADEAVEALLRAGGEAARPVISAFDTAIASAQTASDIKAGKTVPLVKTGLRKLDAEIGGFGGGELAIILGKSGMGKSAYMGGLCLSSALSGVPTIVFSLEMTRKQWVDRMVCDLEHLRHATETFHRALWYSKIRNGTISHSELERYILAARELDGLPLEIIDEGGLTIRQISARARAFASRHGKRKDGTLQKGLVILDYLQIVEPLDFRASREQQIAGNARGAKMLAKRLDWPVVAGSQMNEEDKNRTSAERRPQPSDVRESRAIQHEADLILAPFREAVAVLNRRPLGKGGEDPDFLAWKSDLAAVINKFALLGLKNRNGNTFDLDLWCDMACSAVRDAAPWALGSAETERAQRDMLEAT